MSARAVLQARAGSCLEFVGCLRYFDDPPADALADCAEPVTLRTVGHCAPPAAAPRLKLSVVYLCKSSRRSSPRRSAARPRCCHNLSLGARSGIANLRLPLNERGALRDVSPVAGFSVVTMGNLPKRLDANRA